MGTVAWMVIPAIIVALINSWLQFWLKERSDKSKALADVNPATNQPNADEPARFAFCLVRSRFST